MKGSFSQSEEVFSRSHITILNVKPVNYYELILPMKKQCLSSLALKSSTFRIFFEYRLKNTHKKQMSHFNQMYAIRVSK